MAIRYAPEERAALDARARAMLAECPDVGSFIRRGLGSNSSGEAIVYLRTALDPAPAVTSADAFRGLLGSASRWLRRNGVGPRDVVSLLAPNCTATSVAYWAAMSSAAVQPLNLLFTREAIAAQVAAVGAKILFAPPPGAPGGLFEKVEGLRALAPRLERIVVLPLDGTVAFNGEEIVPDGDANERAGKAQRRAEPDRVVALLPTGGTTGAPKVVPLTNRNVVSSAIASMLAGEFRAVDRIMVALPLFHVGGSFCASLAGLGAGATLVIPTAGGFRNPEVVANFWRIVEAQRLTVGGLVPTGLGAAAAVPTAGADISRLRLFQTGASVCPPEIERRFLSVWPGDCVRQIYGMTEFAGAITQTPWDREQRQGSVGGPVALAEVAVLAGGRNPSRRLAERRNPRARTADVLRLFRPEADRRDFPRRLAAQRRPRPHRRGRRGLCHRPRQGRDHPQRPQYRSRRHRGRRACAIPASALAAAVGRPDAYAGETPILFVTPSPGAAIDRAALADFVRAGVAEPAGAAAIDRRHRRNADDAGRQDIQAAPARDRRRGGGAGIAGGGVAGRSLRGRRFAHGARPRCCAPRFPSTRRRRRERSWGNCRSGSRW